MEKTVYEVKRLQSCINDLVSVLALAAIWSGGESRQIIGTLLEALIAILRLDFACARLNDSIDGSPIEVVRLAQRRNPSAQPQEVARALSRWLSGDQSAPRFVIPNPVGEGEVAVASFALGLQDGLGVVVVGSRRADFPTDIELLLLRVAANQAAIGLQEARRSGEQKRVAEALEQRVAERTSQLSAVNQELRRSQAYLAEAQRLSDMGSFGWSLSSGEILWSEETHRIFQYHPTTKPTVELILKRVHPEDVVFVKQTIERAARDTKDFDHEYRLLMPDGSVKHVHVVAHASSDELGSIEYVGAVMDVTVAKEAEDKIRQSEGELRQLIDLLPQHIAVLGPDRRRLFSETSPSLNQAALDYHGITLEEWQNSGPGKFFHPDDWERLMSEDQRKVASGLQFESESRLLKSDGQYRWFLFRHNPVRDQHGHIIRWIVTATDIEDRKQTEQRLQYENIALREEIDKASMFEEIVGTSPVLQTVISRLSKVAPTDSSVLITGETGTGKELVARAIHRRSRRSSRAFVSVNCAAIPRDLIASELFGHEKGAFTGALQRHLGRFESAEGGTIFLDEIGELPAETQIALLRVLQEHEFERVGGNRSIRTDVRVIAATNRDLDAAISAGTFRSDLFYRLNVFPIEIPPLRERREDIPLLVEYFIDRYARKAGKGIRSLNKRTLGLLQAYPWPGNIRELQNVIERSVIVCETENFSVDESWLSRQPLAAEPKSDLEFSQRLAAQEKELIEAALSKSGGRVFGPLGAAAKLGMPRSTLESKIRTLKIDKNRFKTTESI